MPSPFFTPPERPRTPAPRVSARPNRRAFWIGVALLGFAAGVGGGLWRQTRSLTDAFLAREIRDFRWVVFLNEHADRPFIEGRLLANPGVRLLRFVSKEEALERARQWPALAEGLALSARNPLPESFEVEWDAAVLRPELLEPIGERVAALDGVADVGVDRSRLERLALLRRLSEQAGFGGLFAFSVAVGVVLFWAAHLLFGVSISFPWKDAGVGAAVGAAGGLVGTAVVWAWLGAGDPWSAGAAPLLGVLAVLGRTV